MTTDRRKLLIDTDTASDDAVALVMALRDPGVEVLAITVVAGNVPLTRPSRTRCTRWTWWAPRYPCTPAARVRWSGSCTRPRSSTAGMAWATSGCPSAAASPAPGHAVDVLADLIAAHAPGELTLVTLGPLTNIAVLFTRHPELAAPPARGRRHGRDGRRLRATSRLRPSSTSGSTRRRRRSCTGPVHAWSRWAGTSHATYATFDAAQAADLRAVGRLGAFAVDIQAVLTDLCARPGRG